MKPATKHERNALKARKRSQQNTENRKRLNAQQRRGLRRNGSTPVKTTVTLTLADLESKTVSELRDLCAERGIKVTTKMRKKDLIEMLGFRS